MSGWGMYGFSVSAFELARGNSEKLHAILRNLQSSAYGVLAAADSGTWSAQDASRLRFAAQRIHRAAENVDENALQVDEDMLGDLHVATVGAVQALYDQITTSNTGPSVFIADRVLEAYAAIQSGEAHRAIGALRAAQPEQEGA
jgi:hypothetical protein